MHTSKQPKVLGAAAGLVVCAVGVGLLLARYPGPLGTILVVLGAGFAGTLLASLWIYRSQN